VAPGSPDNEKINRGEKTKNVFFIEEGSRAKALGNKPGQARYLKRRCRYQIRRLFTGNDNVTKGNNRLPPLDHKMKGDLGGPISVTLYS